MKQALLVLVLVAAWPHAMAHADGAQPAYLSISEIEPRRFELVWRVPWHQGRILSIQPQLPDGFEDVGRPEREITAAGLEERRTVQAPLWSGEDERLAVHGVGAALTETLVRVRFLDGTTTTRILSPGKPNCSFPRARQVETSARPQWPLLLQSGTREGLEHLVSAWGHLLLLLALCLCTSRRTGLWSLGLLLAGQLGGLAVGRGLGWTVAPAPIEALFGVTAALLLAQRLNQSGPVRTSGVCLGLGILHGIVLGAPGEAPLIALIGRVIGMDLGQVLLLLVISLLPLVRAAAPLSALGAKWLAYVSGSMGIALALATVFAPPPARAEVVFAANLSTIALDAREPGQVSTSLAQSSAAPIQIFVQSEPDRLRVELLLQATALPGGTGSEELIPVAEQAALQARARVWAQSLVMIQSGETPVPMEVDAAYFVSASSVGVLEREVAIPEERATARIGVSLSAPIPPAGAQVSVALVDAPDAFAVPLTIVQEGGVRTEALQAPAGSFAWSLEHPRAEVVRAVERSERYATLPLLPALLATTALGLFVWGWRRGKTWHASAARLLAGLACLGAPLTPLSIPLSNDELPPPKEIEAVSEALLANVYRALSVREEAAAYDRLAVSVVGSLREEIYLKQRKALALEGRGGARARVESVEVRDVDEVAALDGGYRADVSWTAAGSVIHFGHRHVRRNNYKARLHVVADGSSWKIGALEILELERVR